VTRDQAKHHGPAYTADLMFSTGDPLSELVVDVWNIVLILMSARYLGVVEDGTYLWAACDGCSIILVVPCLRGFRLDCVDIGGVESRLVAVHNTYLQALP
jgi:hypothetical protein